MDKYYLQRLEVDVTNKCNLNCASCTHFSPLTQEVEEYDVIQFRKDLERISELFVVNSIVLLGGEPLLNDNLENLIDACYVYLPRTVVSIYTNGLLVNKLERLRVKYPRLVIVQSKYPIVSRYEKSLCNNKYYFLHPNLNLEGNADPVVSMDNCHSRGCISLWNGKIYRCPVVKNIHIFEKYFNVNFNLAEEDCAVDIYNHSSEEILTFIHSLIWKCCRICNFTHKPVMWSLSKKDLSEWVDNEKYNE